MSCRSLATGAEGARCVLDGPRRPGADCQAGNDCGQGSMCVRLEETGPEALRAPVSRLDSGLHLHACGRGT